MHAHTDTKLTGVVQLEVLHYRTQTRGMPCGEGAEQKGPNLHTPCAELLLTADDPLAGLSWLVGRRDQVL